MKKNESKIGETKKKSKNNNVLFGIACAFLGVLVILAFFLAKKDQIFTNLKKTNFFERGLDSSPQISESRENLEKSQQNEAEKAIPLKNDFIAITIESENEKKSEISKPTENKPEENLNDARKSEIAEKNQTKTEQKVKTPVKNESETEKKSQEVKNQKTTVANSEIQLCFLTIDDDGYARKKIVTRAVPKNDSPLTNAINLLLKGPDAAKNEEKNCATFIPTGVKLLSAKVQNGIAYLNFNDALEFNENGEEGRKTSLAQIVFTATYFPTVNSAQFLIDGKKQDYLGSEGFWIGSPLTTKDFPQVR